MNATGWGGRRSGTGPKPRRRFLPAPPTPDESGVTALPPEDMPIEQRDFWHRYALLAIEKGTLTVHTVAAFRLLCELDSEKRATKATIDTDGRTFLKVTVDGAGVEHQELKAHPLTSTYARHAKAVEALLARFGLAPFGKAEPVPKKPPQANPWATVGAK